MAASTDGALRHLRKELAAQVSGRSSGREGGLPAPDDVQAIDAGQGAPPHAPAESALGTLDSFVGAALANQPALLRSIQRLDASQRAAVTAPARATLVRAPVGSGKTTVLAHRVLWLHHAMAVPLRRIAALTFTQAAAQELVGRVESLVQDPGQGDGFTWFGTFHGVARAALARHMDGSPVSVCDEAHSRDLLARVGASARLGKRQLASMWDDLALLRRGATHGWTAERLARATELLLAYKAELAAQGKVDFDGLNERFADWAKTAPDAAVPLWVVVDELQDCSELELRSLAALRRPETGLFAVGDPDQAIYGWRGGRGDVFEHLAATWPASVVALDSNYRSTPQIGRAASAAIGRTGRAQVHHIRGAGAAVCVRRHPSAQLEGLYLADRLRVLRGQGAAWPGMAVLARTREQLAVLRTVLTDAGIPCAKGGRADDWGDRPAAHWLLRLLAALDGTGEAGVIDLRAALTAKPFAVGKPSTWPAPWLRKACASAPEAPAVVHCAQAAREEGARTFLNLLAALEAAVPAGAPASDAAAVEAHLGLAARLHPSHRDHLRDLGHVRQVLAQLIALRGNAGWTFAAAARSALADRPPADAAALPDDGVALRTFHAAKGLEFDHVFVSGCNQGVVPLATAFADRAQWSEERRLLYVAMTRARDTLELSWLAQPPIRGGMPMPSEWLLALPADATHWADEFGGADRSAPAGQKSMAPTAPAAPVDDAAVVANAVWPPGTSVRHPKYGAGTVLRCDETQVHVAFGKLGERSFSLLLCPLVPA
ncbi:MAG: ATP-dependent helicase [Deltaproteobacteria bacterium]|nr:ATP-dependent helicase [Deltaproteobacteria bacterium]